MKKRYYLAMLTLFIGCALVFLDLSFSFAQESITEEFTLEEITVTAQKREENQQKVAMAMDVISGEDIQGIGKNDLDKIISESSSVLIHKTTDGMRVSIRGMYDSGTPQYGQSMSTPSVAVNTDGVYSNRKDTGNSLYDLERVEVLYGPQSTMYSSNSPGGIVNIVTASPKLGEYSGSGTVEYGSYNYLHTEGAINAPMGDYTALRVSFNTSTRDNYISGVDEAGEDTKSARLKALFSPNDRVSISTNIEHSRTGGAGFGGGVTPFGDQDEVDDPWTATDIRQSIGSNDMTANKFSANIDWDTAWGAISFVPSYSTRSGDNTNVIVGNDPDTGEETSTNYYQTQTARETGVELRMASPDDFFFKWIAGTTYYKSSDSQYRASEDYVEDPTSGSYSTTDVTEKMHAIFANVTYPVKDTLRLTAGFRSSWDTMSSENLESQQGDIQSVEMENNGKPDYKIGFEYDLGEDSMLYADYSTSYRVTGLAFAAPGDPDVEQKPEKLKSYTLGSKNRFLGNKLQLNAAAYYYDYQDYEVTESGTVFVDDEMVNDAAYDFANGYLFGADVQANAIITSKDTINLSVSYIKSEWEHLVFDHEYLDDTSYNGVSMPNTPEWTISASYNHIFSLSNGGVLKAGISSKYQTEYDLTWKEDDLPYSHQESYHKEDFNMVYTHSDGKWTLSGYVNNMFNYAVKMSYMSVGMGSGMMSISDPRTYGTVLTIKF